MTKAYTVVEALIYLEIDCQEIGLVALMFFFELLFPYVSSSISFYVSFANLFSIILFPYLLITRDTQEKEKQDSILLIQETV